MKWPGGPSTFRARVFWSVIPIVLLLLVCQGGISVLQHRQLVTDEFTRRAHALTTNLAGSSELAVFTEDPALLGSAMTTVTGDPDVAYVMLYGDGGKLLTQGGRQVDGLSESIRTVPPGEVARLVASGAGEGRRISDGGRRFLEFAAPIVSQEAALPGGLGAGLPGAEGGAGQPDRRKIVGGVRVGLSLERLDQQARRILELWAVVATIFVLVSTVVVYAFSRRITRPIKQLTGQAEQIARGDLDQRIPVGSRDEIGTLAATFNDMARALKANIAEKEKALAELSDLNRTLEDRIAERTAELTDRTAALQGSLEEVRALAEVSHAVSSSLDLHEVLQTVSEHAVRLSASDACGIFEIDSGRHGFVAVATRGLSEDLVATLRDRAADAGRSLVESAMRAGHPVQIADVEAAREFPFRDLALREGFRALIAVPMGSRGTARSLVLCRRAPRPYDERAASLLTALANQSRIAIDNARLFREIESQRVQLEHLSRDQEQLYRLSTAMQEPLSLREQLSRVLEGARQVVQIDRFQIWVVEPDGDRFLALAGAGLTDEEARDFAGLELPLAVGGAMALAFREGRSLVFDQNHGLPSELRLPTPYAARKALRTQRFVVVPMVARGRRVGVLTADNKQSGAAIPPRTVELLQIFASHAAVGIENARLFQEIEEKGRQLEVASRHKSQFLANMSHELRTPLNAILGYTELIQDRIYGDVPEKIGEVLDRVQKSGRHLLSLINDVLDLSKIEAGQLVLALADYSIKDVVYSVFAAMESLAAEKKLALNVVVLPDLPVGRGDERRISQVLMNLVGNAIKFTERGEVRVEVTQKDATFLVSVSDTGPGIAPADQAKLFQEFQQIDSSSTKKAGGTGLGLAIARRITEMHGGRIWVESAPGQGATFRFALPVRTERAVPSAAPPTSPPVGAARATAP